LRGRGLEAVAAGTLDSALAEQSLKGLGDGLIAHAELFAQGAAGQGRRCRTQSGEQLASERVVSVTAVGHDNASGGVVAVVDRHTQSKGGGASARAVLDAKLQAVTVELAQV
jgi:hypothetical protein